MMIEAEEVWFDAAPGGEGTCIRFSVKPEHLGSIDAAAGGSFPVEIVGPNGVIGYVEVKFIAFIKWRAILEVVALHSAGSEFQPQGPVVSLFSAPQQAQT